MILPFINLVFISLLPVPQEPLIKFVVESNKEYVWEGECVVFSAYLLVNSNNKVDVRFPPDLVKQIGDIRNQLLEVKNGFFHESHFTQIKKERYEDESGSFTKYRLYELAICPENLQEINISQQKLKLLKGKGIIELKSDPLKVRVTPIPDSIKNELYQNYFFSMVGDFEVHEKFIHQDNFKVGDTINYELRILGDGITFPINLNVIDTSSFVVNIKSSLSYDTIRYDDLRARKSFILELVPIKALKNYKLSNLISWNYFSTKDGKVVELAPSSSINVKNSEVPFLKQKDTIKASTIIAIDVSISMHIQDYTPNRLKTASQIAESLLQNGCVDVDILLFCGNVIKYDACDFASIDFSGDKRGTAIGSALWEAIQLMKGTEGNKKIILIGDGDETSGSVSGIRVAKLAKELSIKIDCIGIGYSSPAPFYAEELQRIVFVENTFRDDLFKKIANISGGAYYWISKDDNPEAFLSDW